MLFPNSPRIIYSKNPLVGVICQLNFPAILKIDTEAPATFQERIRQQYPVYQETRGMSLDIQLPPQIANSAPPVRFGNATYQFIDEAPDAVWTVTLTQSSLSVSTSSYSRWEDFREHLIQPLQGLVEIYSPAFFTRVGLRYQDIIRRSALGIGQVPWKELLNPQIAGIFSAVTEEDDVEVAQNQAVVHLDESRKVLLQYGLLLEEATGERCYLIDNDFYVENRTEVADARHILDILNQTSGRVFRWCITEQLHEALEPMAVD